MKGVKVAAILLLAIVLCMTAVGCAQSFTYTEYTDNQGEVHRDFLLVYDPAASDAAEVKEKAVQAMRTYVQARDLTDYAVIDDRVDGEVALYLTFPSITDYYIVLGYTGREENEPTKPTVKGFINRYDLQKESFVTQSNVDFVRALLSEEDRDFPLSCDFYYTYGTTSKTTTSNGEIKEKGGVYYHTWKLKYDEPADMVISVYSPNGIILMSVIISIFVLSLAIIFVIIFIVNKKNKGKDASEPFTESVQDGAEPPKE